MTDPGSVHFCQEILPENGGVAGDFCQEILPENNGGGGGGNIGGGVWGGSIDRCSPPPPFNNMSQSQQQQQEQPQHEQQQVKSFEQMLQENLNYYSTIDGVNSASQASSSALPSNATQARDQQDQSILSGNDSGRLLPADSIMLDRIFTNNNKCHGDGMVYQDQLSSEDYSLVSLRRWMFKENEEQNPCEKKEHLIRKTTVAYGIAELLRKRRKLIHSVDAGRRFCFDNFAVLITRDSDSCGWNNVQGVAMISPSIQLRFIEPFVINDNFFDECNSQRNQQAGNSDDELDGLDGLGRDLEVTIENESGLMYQDGGAGDDFFWCHSLGVLLHELFAKSPPFSSENNANLYKAVQVLTEGPEENEERCAKKRSESQPSSDAYVPLLELGLPSSISLFVKNLLDCKGWEEMIDSIGWGEKEGTSSRYTRPHDAYASLQAANQDLRLMLKYPNRFLFDKNDNVTFTGDKKISSGSGSRSTLLHLRKNRLYGRDSQFSLLSDSLSRVSLTGQSEAIFVSGYAGSGKTRLVETVMEHFKKAGGYVIVQKCDQMQQERPLSVVLSAMNQLPLLILRNNSPAEIDKIVNEITSVFGPYLSTLARVIPNIIALIPQPIQGVANNSYAEDELNLYNLHFLILLFMRVVSSKERPVFLFLDDLHWSCKAALDLILATLSDRQGSNCLFFVGSYRNNEIQPDHAIFGFMEKLASLNVPVATVHLDGMTVDDLNCLVADALCLLPHCCRPLTQILYQKTKGNPFFTVSVMRSLVDRGLIRYSVRERRIVWDGDKIRDEGISDNVLHLLSSKIVRMPAIQSALKIASCFGERLHSDVVKCLSRIPEYHGIEGTLDDAIREGFMERSEEDYRFVHDKVREAAYSLIPKEKSEFHFHLGMSLYNNTPQEYIKDDLIFLVPDQINHGNPKLIPPSQLINVAGLNFSAGKKSMSTSNFTAARLYLSAAIRLLPDGHWREHYDMSKQLYFLLGNAALAAGYMTEASDTVNLLINNGRCLGEHNINIRGFFVHVLLFKYAISLMLAISGTVWNPEDKLDAYYILVLALHAQCKPKKAYETCLDVLSQLGEDIPSSVDLDYIFSRVNQIQGTLEHMSDDDLLNFKVVEGKTKLSLVQFYCEILFASYFLKLDSGTMHFYSCRLMELCLEHGISKYSARAFSQFGMMLGGNTIKDAEGSYRIGKLALQFLSKSNAVDQLPSVYSQYYGYIAVHREPFQSCADMLRQAHEVGLSVGALSSAVYSGIHYLAKALIAGTKLVVLREEIEYQARLIDRQKLAMPKVYMAQFQCTLNALMEGTVPAGEEKESSQTDMGDAFLFHEILRSFWKGHYSRCNFYAEKYSKLFTEINQMKRTKTNDAKKQTAKNALDAVRRAATESKWNYANKVHLLEAELYSLEGKYNQASGAYNSAIAASRTSKFIHEQGLSCELAGLHYKKLKNNDMARDYLNQAQHCYREWGSQIKVDYIADLLLGLQKRSNKYLEN